MRSNDRTARHRFITSLEFHQRHFEIILAPQQLNTLADYYEIVQQHNPLLHLVGPCSPEGFAVRHILESLTLLEYLPKNAKFADVGAGAGLPSIPCLIVRNDLSAALIESKEKKAKFLDTAISELGLKGRAIIVNRQFEETDPGDSQFVTCRAIDKFTQRLQRMIKWSRGRTLLFFGGPALRSEMERLGLTVRERLMPLSDQRYLFVSCSE